MLAGISENPHCSYTVNWLLVSKWWNKLIWNFHTWQNNKISIKRIKILLLKSCMEYLRHHACIITELIFSLVLSMTDRKGNQSATGKSETWFLGNKAFMLIHGVKVSSFCKKVWLWHLVRLNTLLALELHVDNPRTSSWMNSIAMKFSTYRHRSY